MLRLRALEVAAAVGIRSGLFVVSNPWKASFLRRHRLSFRARNRSGQSRPDDDNSFGGASATEACAWMEEHGVETVYNADKTAVFIEMLPKKTLARHQPRFGAFVMSPPDRGDVAEWVSQSWLSVPSGITISSFSHCGFIERVVAEGGPLRPADSDAPNVVALLSARGCLDSCVGEVEDSADAVDAEAEAAVWHTVEHPFA
ncbi:hypothetical protein PybrP1_011591 [[Pythium] brassicae (nom. inval.)]|nr:hypothetical protein PybrP1_011591 [[Pythium] brassicae (nom. inval.)]